MVIRYPKSYTKSAQKSRKHFLERIFCFFTLSEIVGGGCCQIDGIRPIHYDSVGLMWSAEFCNVSFIDGRILYHERKNNQNSLSLVYEGVNFLHSCFRFLTMDVDISPHVDRYKWVKSGDSNFDDHVHYLLS